MQQHTLSLEERLEFLRFDEDVRHALKQAWNIISPRMDHILDIFYGHLISVPHLKGIIGSQERIPGLKKAQFSHWEQLFSGVFNESYMARAKAIGEAHYHIKLEQNWYMGGYCLVLDTMVDLITQKYKKNAPKAAYLIRALNKVFFLDMDLSLSVYNQKIFEEMRERQGRRSQAVSDFSTTISPVLGSLNETGLNMRSMSETMFETANQTSQHAATVSSAACHASENVETVSRNAAELIDAINAIADKVVQSQDITFKAVSEVETTNELVGGLTQASEAIGEVIKLINDIAGQTNMLALNATIEAARAGDAGKGFAVVASEVKNLAQQTGVATEQIAQQISAIQSATRQTNQAMKDIGEVIEQSSQIAETIAAAVEQQNAAIQEIVRNTTQASNGTKAVVDEIAQVEEAARKSKDSAENLKATSHTMQEVSSVLRTELEDFFVTVQSGHSESKTSPHLKLAAE